MYEERNQSISTWSPLLMALALVGGCADPCADDGVVQSVCAGGDDASEQDTGDATVDDGGFIDADSQDGGSSASGVDDGSSGDGGGEDEPGDDGDDGAANGDAGCGQEYDLAPLLVPHAQVEAGVGGLCLGCAVHDEELIIDQDLQTYGRIDLVANVEGSGYVGVSDSSQVYAAGTRVGVVVATGDDLLVDSVLERLSITTMLEGQPREQDITGGLLDLELLAENEGRFLLSFETTQPYDGVRLDAKSVVGGLDGYVEVYAACFEPRSP